MNFLSTTKNAVSSTNRISLSEGDSDRIRTIILRFTLIAWFSSKLLCYKLWLSDRIFPIVPTIHLGFEMPSIVHTILFIGSLSVMLVLFLMPQKRSFLQLLLALEIAGCLLDQTRWQAWEYQYLLMTVIFITNWKHQIKTISLLAVLLSCTYIFSGICKLNAVFVQFFWQLDILHNLLYLPEHIVQNRIVHRLGYLLPGTEVVGGILFLFKRTRRVGAGLLILMHLLTLIILGPFGINYNSSVWSWNLVMMVYLYLIGIRQQKVQFKEIISRNSMANLPVIVLMTVMPIVGLLDHWPHFLSFSLYSYKAKQLVISIDENTANFKLLETYFEGKKNYTWANANSRQLILHNWAMSEMNTPPFPEEGYYKKLKVAFINKYPGTKAHFFIYKSEKHLLTELK